MDREMANLSPEDREVLDMLMECGFDASQLPPMSPERHQRVEALQQMFNLLSDYPVEDADDLLVDATLARIGRHDKRAPASISFAAAREQLEVGARRAWRVPDLISIAAVILIISAVAFPVLANVQRTALDNGCANNMRVLANAFTSYANDYQGQMPMARAGIGHGWDMFSNSLHLRPLIDNNYCDLGHLDCPGNHNHDGPSYSYQQQSPNHQYLWGVKAPAVVLADRNPLIDAARALKNSPSPMTLSINHGGRGQNVLQGDGAVVFLIQPTVGRDNLWLPEGKSRLEQGDEPKDDRDIFLAH